MKRTNIMRSPAPSFAESFATAKTSPDDEDDDYVSPARLGPSPSTLSPPQPLRKSISVDSFSQYSPSRQPDSPRTPVDQSSSRQPWITRHRGESLGSVNHPVARPLDADGDRYDPLSAAATVTERYRRASLKTTEQLRHPVRAGDLPLPSRSHNNSISTTASVPGVAESISPSASRPSSFKSAANRSRSGSLAHPNPIKRIAIDTQMSSMTPVNRDVVLAVVGTAGCGKSTLIRKGLAPYALDDPTVISEQPKYVLRQGTLSVDETSRRYPLQVISVEIQSSATSPPSWPPMLPPIDGVILCYDSSKRSSYFPIEGLVKHYRLLGHTVVVVACKSDIGGVDRVDFTKQSTFLKNTYDTGLIGVSINDSQHKEKMNKSFDWVLKAIMRTRDASNPGVDNRNPASPAILDKSDPLEKGWPGTTVSPTPSTHVPSSTKLPATSPSLDYGISPIADVLTDEHTRLKSKMSHTSLPPNPPTTMPPLPASPLDQLPDSISSFPSLTMPERTTAQASIGGLPTHSIEDFTEAGLSSAIQSMQSGQTYESFESEEGRNELEQSPGAQDDNFHQATEDLRNGRREPKYVQWAKLDELLDKLLFLSISGDDPTYATHFLLTYRRFATPRSVLLAMQKRMRQLDGPCGDPMFASFAQMRICHLLQTWIRDYPNDFAVKGTLGALNALIKSIISKTHLLHYGSDFLPFLEQLPGLHEEDTDWAVKAEVMDVDSDDYNEEEEDDETRPESEEPESEGTPNLTEASSSTKVAFPSRERKQSLPLPKALLSPLPNPVSPEPTSKQLLRDLGKLAQEVMNTDSEEIAQEITRQCARKFLVIKPRDWLQFTFVSKKAEHDPIQAYNAMANHFADWVVSLILCHDRPRQRARQIEKLVDIAYKIRQMNNYSGLRAFVAGINIASDNATLEAFKQKAPEAAKNLMSWDVLLRQIRSHRAYRMALRNSKGGCIPALEVHIQDLIKTDVGNKDHKEGDPTLIHWGKFNMMGRFTCTVSQCQAQCRNSADYDFPDRRAIAELFVKRPVMSQELQEHRLNLNAQDDIYDDSNMSIPITTNKDPSILRKLFFS